MAAVPPPGSPSAGQQVGPKQIYDELIAQGAGTVRAIGIMANMINESSLNPEAVQQGVADPGYGLVQWEASSYPQAPNLVTGNPLNDMKAQITFLAQTGGFTAANGSTPAQSAGNFAADYERCAECAPGESQYNSRQGNASTVEGWVSAGEWPTAGGDATGQAQVNTAATTQEAATCVWTLPKVDLLVGSIGGQCLLSKTQARALISAGILIAGGVTALVAVLMISGTANKIGQAANAALLAVPGGGAAKGAIGVFTGNSPSGTTPPPAKDVPATPPPRQGPMAERPKPRTGGRTQQGSSK